MPVVFDRKNRRCTLCVEGGFANRVEATCQRVSYIKHAELACEKPVTLNISCHAAGGAAVSDASGQTQPCFQGHLYSHLSHPVPKNTMESEASGDSLCFMATRSVPGTFLVPF